MPSTGIGLSLNGSHIWLSMVSDGSIVACIMWTRYACADIVVDNCAICRNHIMDHCKIICLVAFIVSDSKPWIYTVTHCSTRKQPRVVASYTICGQGSQTDQLRSAKISCICWSCVLRGWPGGWLLASGLQQEKFQLELQLIGELLVKQGQTS